MEEKRRGEGVPGKSEQEEKEGWGEEEVCLARERRIGLGRGGGVPGKNEQEEEERGGEWRRCS